MKNVRNAVLALSATVALSSGSVAGFSFLSPANASTAVAVACDTPTIVVTDSPATPEQWWNWSPNNTKGPQDYVPNFPTDSRGTWQGPHDNGGPSQGTYGTFNVSNGNSGNSSWFHRNAATDEVTHTEPNPDYPCQTQTTETTETTQPTESTEPTETTTPSETPSDTPSETVTVPTETPTETPTATDSSTPPVVITDTPTVTQTTTEPTASPTPVISTPTQTATEAVVTHQHRGDGTPPTTSVDVLPNTGGPNAIGLIAGLVAVGAGLVFVLVARRRTN